MLNLEQVSFEDKLKIHIINLISFVIVVLYFTKIELFVNKFVSKDVIYFTPLVFVVGYVLANYAFPKLIILLYETIL